MKVICPNCNQRVELPDDTAGKMAHCPLCNVEFQAPELVSQLSPKPMNEPTPPAITPPTSAMPADLKPHENPTPSASANSGFPVSTPATVPGMAVTPSGTPVTSAAAERAFPGTEPATAAASKSDLPIFSFSVPIDVVRWLPFVCLVLPFILSFFSWNGVYPAGYKAYSQNAWQNLFARFSIDPVSEEQMLKGADLKSHIQSAWWMLPYLILLLGAVILEIGGFITKQGLVKLPPSLERFWKYRPLGVTVISALCLLFLSLQWIVGFGLERAAIQIAEENKVYVEDKSKANTPEKEQKAEIFHADRLSEFHLRTTWFLLIAWFAHLIALLGIAYEAYLVKRGALPPPRFALLN